MNRVTAVFIVLLLAPQGCGSGPDEAGPLPAWELEEVFRKDGMRDPQVQLNRLGSLGVGPGGNLYLTQWQVPEVLVIDSTGRFQATVGRGGTGPGEFVSPATLGWIGDSLWVGDPRGARIEVFDRSLRPATSIRFTIRPASEDRYARVLGPYRLLGDGTVLARASGISISGAVSGEFSELVHVRTNRSGDVLDTIVSIPIPSRDFLSLEIGEERWIQTAHPIMTMSLLVPLQATPGFVLIERPLPLSADAAEIRLLKLSLSGDTIWARSDVMPAVPVTEEFKNRWYERMAPPGSERSPGAERLVQVLREDVQYPAFLPGATAARASSDGSIWVRTPSLDPDSLTWRIYDSLGTPVATASARKELMIRRIGPDHLWGTFRNEYDVPVLVRYRILR